jgi:holo-[acyl-carrier protein] synthase
MIVGIGCDLESISALEKADALRTPGLMFTASECRYIFDRPDPLASLTGHFAAKEAFFKALPFPVEFNWTDIEVLHDVTHAPRFSFSGGLGRAMAARGWQANLSMSHSGDYAAAFVTLSSAAGGAA